MDLMKATTPGQLKIVSDLARTIWHEHYTPIIGSEQVEYMLQQGLSVAMLERQLKDDHACFVLAKQDDRFVGFSGLVPHVEERVAWLDKLYVHKTVRGQGVGRELMAQVKADTCCWQMHRIMLRVNRYNIDSIRAYERLGFSVIGEDKKDIGNGFVMDDYMMAAHIEQLRM